MREKSKVREGIRDKMKLRKQMITSNTNSKAKDVEENVGLIVYQWCNGRCRKPLAKTGKERKNEDEKTTLNLENSNKSLSAELTEVKKDLHRLQENLKILEDMNLQFEN
ncbi:hypothetical protein H8958_009893 [Nasalis larvatus]